MSAPLYATGPSGPPTVPPPWWLRLPSRLPLKSLYAMAACAVWVMRRVVRHRVATVRTNIERSFPHASREERRRIERRYYRNLSQILAEWVKTAALDREQLARHVWFRNPEVIRDVIGAGHSALVMCAHQCNWEWQLLALSAQLEVSVQSAYKPLRTGRAEHLLRTLRSRFGAELLPASELLSHLLSRHDPRLITMVADQAPVSSDMRHWTGFLSQPTAFFMEPEKIAQATPVAVIFAGMRRITRGHYEVICEQLLGPGERAAPGEITERYVHAVEQQVRAAPADWLWSHRRWQLAARLR